MKKILLQICFTLFMPICFMMLNALANKIPVWTVHTYMSGYTIYFLLFICHLLMGITACMYIVFYTKSSSYKLNLVLVSINFILLSALLILPFIGYIGLSAIENQFYVNSLLIGLNLCMMIYLIIKVKQESKSHQRG